ncbi:MAG TPA: VanZ family protein [Pseudomonadales bacterium]
MLFVLRVLFFLLVWSAVFYGLFSSQPAMPDMQGSDKLLHLLAFAGMAFSARLVFVRVAPWLFWPVMLALAVALEFLQPLVQPSRHFSEWDIVANGTGVACALLACRLLQHFFARQWRAIAG